MRRAAHRVAAAVLSTLALSGAASAQSGADLFSRTPSPEAQALVKAIGPQNLMMPPTRQHVLTLYTPILMLNPGHNDEVLKAANTSLALIQTLKMYDALAPQLANAFDASFQPGDLEGLQRFFEQPLGATFAARQAVVASQIMVLVNILFETPAGRAALSNGLDALTAKGWTVPAHQPRPLPDLPDNSNAAASAQELVRLLGIGALMGPSARQYVTSMISMLQMQPQNRDKDPKNEDVRAAIAAVMTQLETGRVYELFSPHVAKLYQVTLVADELRELDAFFATELGRKFAAGQRDVSERASELSLLILGTREGMAAVMVGTDALQKAGLNVGPYLRR